MAKYKLQEMSDMRDEGKRRVYPKMVPYRTLSRKEFIEKMQSYHRDLSLGTIEAVLTDVEDVLVRMLSMGYNVNLEGLGTFSLSLGFEDDKPTEMQTDDDMMKYRKVGVKNVNFNPSPEFVKAVKMETDCDLEREMSGVKVLKLFRGEPAISGFDWNFSATHSSSAAFSTEVGSVLHLSLIHI